MDVSKETPVVSEAKVQLASGRSSVELTSRHWEQLAETYRLSRRELQTAQCLFLGLTRAAVARRLGCSPDTVRVYVDRLFHKLEVAGRLEFAIRVAQVAVG